MKTRAAVLNAKESIIIREFELPAIKEEELLVKVISNSICLSTYKAAKLGTDHKRVPDNIHSNPIITGHEFSGVIIQVGEALKESYKVGQKFVLQPAMGLSNGYSAGYSYEFFGGNATYTIIPKVAIERHCVLIIEDDYYANASLAEPMSCIIGAFKANYHTTPYVYEHKMGVKKGGRIALLGCGGPMGLGAIDYAVNGPYKPALVVVTDIDEERLNRAKELLPPTKAYELGIALHYIHVNQQDGYEKLMALSNNKGYDDIFVFAAVSQLLEQADDLLGEDGCLNFFAGPTKKDFKVPFNYYNAHYASTHIVGTSGGSTGDMMESLELSASNKMNPSFMITHIGGLDAAPSTILNLPNIGGGKKLIYPQIDLPLTAIADLGELSKDSEFFAKLNEFVQMNNGVWSREAEKYLLKYHEVSVES